MSAPGTVVEEPPLEPTMPEPAGPDERAGDGNGDSLTSKAAATNEKKRVRSVRAAPSSSGVVVAFDEKSGHGLGVVVLPKLWRRDQKVRHRFDMEGEWAGGSRVPWLYVYENDVIDFFTSEKRERVVDELLKAAGGDEIDDETFLFRTAEPDKSADFDSRPTPQSGDVAQLRALFAMADQVEKHPEQSKGEVSAKFARLPELQPWLHRRFVDSVEQALRFVRRGYIPEEGWLNTVRGRVDVTSIALVQHRARTALYCRYEEFEFQTPLLTVVVSALEVVARSTPARNDPYAAKTRHKAVELRRALAEIESCNPRVAAQRSRSIRLTRAERPWETVLSFARPILEAQEPAPTQRSQTAIEALSLKFQTHELWEKLLEGSFKRVLGSVDVHPTVPKPFSTDSMGQPEEHKKRKPDFAVELLGGASGPWVLDAKYKFSHDVGDEYQLFTHATLYRSSTEREAFGCGFLLPAIPEQEPTYEFRYWMPERRPMFISHLPFPSQDEACEPGMKSFHDRIDPGINALIEWLHQQDLRSSQPRITIKSESVGDGFSTRVTVTSG